MSQICEVQSSLLILEAFDILKTEFIKVHMSSGKKEKSALYIFDKENVIFGRVSRKAI